jgi:hypothetical protein
MIIAVIATVLTAPLILPADADAQAPQNGSAFTITGHAGDAQLLQVNGKSYVEIETLARLTQGTLSLKANRTILTLPPSAAIEQAATPPGEGGVLKSFRRGGHRRDGRDPGMANCHRERSPE